MIEVRDLCFEYPGTRALDGVSFSLPRGAVTALVGPNGAGKSTLLRCLAALEEPFSGSVHIDGMDVQTEPRSCHHRIGYLSDFFGLYEALTVGQALRYTALAHGMEARAAETAVERGAHRLRIAPLLGRRPAELSRGQRQSVAIAQAVLHNPPVALLDEPASGLDPEARVHLAELFSELQGEGMTLVISSHILAELDAYSTRVLIVRDGRLVEDRELAEPDAAQCTLALELSEPYPGLEALLRGDDAVEACDVEELGARCVVAAAPEQRRALLRRLLEAGVPLLGFREVRAKLADFYRTPPGGGAAGTASGGDAPWV